MSLTISKHGKPGPSQRARLRRQVWVKTGGLCFWCGQSLPRNNFTLDHLLPRACGGSYHPINLVPSCAPCNEHRGATIPPFMFETVAAIASELRQIELTERPAHKPRKRKPRRAPKTFVYYRKGRRYHEEREWEGHP